MAHTLSPQQFQPLQDNIHKFIRLMGLNLESQPNDIANEIDVVEYLDYIPPLIKHTKRVQDKQLYHHVEYSFSDDVKQSLDFLLLQSRNPNEDQLMRRKNLTAYHVVLMPTIDLIASLPQLEAINQVDSIINDIKQLFAATTSYGTMQDALDAQDQIRAMVRERENLRKNTTKVKKTRKRSFKKVI